MIIIKKNPFEDEYFDDREFDEVKTQVYYDSKKKIKGFGRKKKCRRKAKNRGSQKTGPRP